MTVRTFYQEKNLIENKSLLENSKIKVDMAVFAKCIQKDCCNSLNTMNHIKIIHIYILIQLQSM